MKRIFLDWASTAPPLSLAVEAQKKAAIELFGNPSSLHGEGRGAKAALEAARSLLAQAAGAQPEEVVFTSGATEANNMVVASILKKQFADPTAKPGRRVVISAIEHASLWEPVQAMKKMGFDVAVCKPDASGIVRPERLRELLDERTVLVVLMLVNNETGAIQPVAECVAAVRDFTGEKGGRIHVHTDAVQAFGKIWFSFPESGADTASLSAHKLGGPRGAGALLVSSKARPAWLFLGGGQEGNRRPGTENLAAVHAFAQSARFRIESLDANHARAVRLMERLIRAARSIPGVLVLPEDRAETGDRRFSPYILSFAVPPVPGEVFVRSLDEQGIAVSTGSACHSSKKDHTRILEAQGVPKAVADSAVRVSIGPETVESEIDAFAAALSETVPLLLRISKPRA
ncbi:MAG: cysteine desulfurase [Spirochaetales bacterium]|nr:cysteine desulfurase [Spirochaetales bacterium]